MTYALLLLAVVLLALGPAAAFFPEVIARRVGVACCLLGLGVAVAGLLGAEAAEVDLPGLRVRLDGLSGWLVMPVLIAGAASVLAGERSAPIGAMLLVLLADNGIVLALALALLCLVLRVRTVSLPIWALCSVIGFSLVPQAGLFLALAGIVALWRGVLRLEAGPFSAAFSALGIYIVTRVTLDLSGLATPVWWGVVVVCFGLVGAVLGGWRAAVAERLATMLAGSAVLSGGLACAGLGVVLAARGADLPPVAALGLEAALLQILGQAVTLALLSICAPASWAALGAAGLAALPPSVGFASFYLLLQALFAANRIGGVGLQFGCACAVAAAGLAVALGALAALRMLGLRMLAATESSMEMRIATIVLAGIGILLGVAPGEALLLVRPALQRLVPAGLVEVSLWAPLLVAALLLGGCVAIMMATRSPVRRAPAWQGGVHSIPNLALYAPALLAVSRMTLPEPRLPRLREWLGVAAAALVLVLIVLAAR